MWFSFWSVPNFQSDCFKVVIPAQPVTSTSSAFPETKVFMPPCSYLVHEDVFYFPSDLSPFVLQDCVAVGFTSFGGKLITETGLVFCLQSDDCAVTQYTAHEVLKHFHTKPVSAFFLVPVKIALLQAFCFTEGEKKKNPRTAETSNLSIPAKRREIALRLQCNFRLWKWNWLHGGRKEGEKMKKKKNCYWNIFSLSLLVLIASLSSGLIAFNVKYMFNIEIVKT